MTASRYRRTNRPQPCPRCRALLARGLAVALSVLVYSAPAAELPQAFPGGARLPDPGYVPNQVTYPLDRIEERIALLYASAGDERLDVCLAFAIEKLAEVIAMVDIEEPGPAWIATGLYKDYLERATRTLRSASELERADLRVRYANTLLEHLYIVATGYQAMTPTIRQFALSPLLTTLMNHLDALRAAMAADEIAALLLTRTDIRALFDTMAEIEDESRMH